MCKRILTCKLLTDTYTKARIISSGNAWERCPQSYFDSGNGSKSGELYKKQTV